MSLIGAYLQTETVHKRLDAGGLRGSTYKPEQTILTRWTPKQQIVSNEAGQEIASDTAIQTEAIVKVGDLLRDEDGRDWPVVSVAVFYKLDGLESHRECFL